MKIDPTLFEKDMSLKRKLQSYGTFLVTIALINFLFFSACAGVVAGLVYLVMRGLGY